MGLCGQSHHAPPHPTWPQVKQLRLEREREKAMREQELEMLQREKEAEHFKTWEEQEDHFHLQQAKLRYAYPIPPSTLHARHLCPACQVPHSVGHVPQQWAPQGPPRPLPTQTCLVAGMALGWTRVSPDWVRGGRALRCNPSALGGSCGHYLLWSPVCPHCCSPAAPTQQTPVPSWAHLEALFSLSAHCQPLRPTPRPQSRMSLL